MASIDRLWLSVLVAVLLQLASSGCGDGQPQCKAGEVGCACGEEPACGEGLVCGTGDKCVAAPDAGDDIRGAKPGSDGPMGSRCYTPCRQSFTDRDGKYIECSADGLLEGCLDGAQCMDGTCVPKERAETMDDSEAMESGMPSHPGACSADVECPDFQRCASGVCRSDCEEDTDCAEGLACFRKTCRTPCSAAEKTCTSGTFCSVQDAEHGFCMPLAEREDKPDEPRVQGGFTLSTAQLEFSNSRLKQTFTLINEAPIAIEFELQKVEHTEYSTAGAVRVTEHPMPWLAIGETGKAERVGSVKVLVEGGGGERTIDVVNEASGLPAKWDGNLVVRSRELGERTISLGYAQGADGRWAGTIYYFSQFADLNLEAWRGDRDDATRLAKVGNALMQRWGALRSGRLTLDEFEAVITATTTGSWKWPSVERVCPTAACYLYTSPSGVESYSDDLDARPIPAGVAELPMALDLRAEDVKSLTGRIVSGAALQYSGNPAVDLTFSGNPSACSGRNSSACLAFVDTFSADIVIGGRYATTADDDTCSGSTRFKHVATPWLLPGFRQGTEIAPKTGLRYTYECRDQYQPLAGADALAFAQNAALSQANPIRDGRSRQRRLELVDGALINQAALYLIVRETFDADFLGLPDQPAMSAYALIALRRMQADLGSGDFEGLRQTATREVSTDVGAAIQCSPELARTVLGRGEVGPSDADAMVVALTDGVLLGKRADVIPSTDVHYLCHDTGRFDGGARPEELREVCPAGSGVTYFKGNIGNLTALPCQQTSGVGTCQSTLEAWRQDRSKDIQILHVYRCTDHNAVLCDSNRVDLKADKSFSAPGDAAAPFVPLLTAIDSAFRYKTRFRNRQGTSLGFAPQICVPDSNAVPYCYDPQTIESVQERVDCLAHLYRGAVAPSPRFGLTPAKLAELKATLQTVFSYTEEHDSNLALPVRHEGFEPLDAELLIMLGGDAYTRAFQSRFDLAGSGLVSFEGSRLEPSGIDLAGVAGYEMYNLYQATQYYQRVLDRFFAMSPFLWESVLGPSTARVVTAKTVTSYLVRVLRASAQKSRALGEIAKRYQSFYRPDLARFVVERGL